MNFDIEDLDGKVLRCTVWNDYALQIKDFISKVPPHEHVMAVIQHGKCKEWKGEYTVQSDKFATRIFLNQEIDEVDELRRRKCLVLWLRQLRLCKKSMVGFMLPVVSVSRR
ncbi:uncharacterized protein LOC110880920 [Helianthus annuus]|uniref:uncharacterized protein LOC110880920 n=1 Tax=Helianthus annuus TaxID=4232 RepID=UPI001653232F|nr:uncharacterized protein LOC110880920 [Helianthus annuus]